jgi:hypothetical protein
MSRSLEAMELALRAFESGHAADRAEAMTVLRAAIQDEMKYERWIGLDLEEMDDAIASNVRITDPNLRDGVYGAIIDLELLLKEKNT